MHAPANAPHLILRLADMDPDSFDVISFSGKERVSAPYELDITVASARGDISHSDVVGARATLFVLRNGMYYPWSGVVPSFVYVDRCTDYTTYQLRLVPSLWLLSLNQRSRVFQRSTLPDIVMSVLEQCGLGDHVETDLAREYPEREFVVQYQETDLDFVGRLLESCGIWYLFREQPVQSKELNDSPVTETLVISDRPESFESIHGEAQIPYRSHSSLNDLDGDSDRESVDRLSVSTRVVPSEVLTRSYNYRTPETVLEGRATVDGITDGSIFAHGGAGHDSEAVQQHAEVLSRRAGSDHERIEGHSSCRGLRAGFRFSLVDHLRRDCNDTYVVTAVNHRGEQNARSGVGAGAAAYHNEFTALRGSRAEQYSPPATTPRPRLPGIITAPIEADGGDYALLDDMGRYKVRLPFDLSGTDNTDGSKYIRQAQPYSGAGYGMHFPSHEGAEMVLACIDGDPDKPLGLGTVPNAGTIPPVVSTNKEQGAIRTAGSNELLMDDTDGEQMVRLATASGNAVVLHDGERRAALRTPDDNLLLLDDENEQCALQAKDHRITLSTRSGEEAVVIETAGGHVVRIDDANARVTLQSSAGHRVDLDDNGRTIVLSDCDNTSTVTLDASSGLSLDSSSDIAITSARDLTLSGANVHLSSTTGTVEAKATQDLVLSGMKASLKGSAGDVGIEGLNVSVKGSMKTAIEGSVGVNISSSVQTKISGAMTEVSGTGMTKVTGGIVMIN